MCDFMPHIVRWNSIMRIIIIQFKIVKSRVHTFEKTNNYHHKEMPQRLTLNNSDGGRAELRLLGWRRIRDKLPSDMVLSVTSTCTHTAKKATKSCRRHVSGPLGR